MSGNGDTRRDHRRRPNPKSKQNLRVNTQRERLVRDVVEILGLHFSPTETAVILGMSVQGVRKWIKRGTLKLGEDYFITPTGLVRIRGSTIKRIVGPPQSSPSGS